MTRQEEELTGWQRRGHHRQREEREPGVDRANEVQETARSPRTQKLRLLEVARPQGWDRPTAYCPPAQDPSAAAWDKGYTCVRPTRVQELPREAAPGLGTKKGKGCRGLRTPTH